MPQDRYVPTREDIGAQVKATVAGRVVGVETGFIDVEVWRGADTAAFVRVQHPTHAVWDRIAPADWPPEPGDVWRDRQGYTWFVYDSSAGVAAVREREFLAARDGQGSYIDTDVEAHLLSRGPLTLLVRAGKTVEVGP